MLDIKFVRENPEIVKQNIRNKFQDKKLPLVDEVLELDKRNREIKQEVQNASLVLVGLGEELTGDMAAFYQELKGLLEHKDYFIVTLKDREGLEAAGLAPEQITAPLVDPEGHESWEKYLHWLSFTLNQKLCVLELGVGFAHPQLVRFPFEKTAYFNKKSRYIRVSGKFPQLSEEIADRGTSVKEDPVKLFTAN